MSGKRALIRGTAILTITSFVTRFMGFFYRIFLGHTFGEENVGLYQLVFPVYALGISFSCAGTELALSRCVAQENAAGHPEKAKELLSTSNLSVSEIAYQLGFEFPQSFNKLFKKKTNLTPLEFKQSFN